MKKHTTLNSIPVTKRVQKKRIIELLSEQVNVDVR